MHRFFVDDQLFLEKIVKLDKFQSKHILDVLRLKINEYVILFNSFKITCICTLFSIEKNLAKVKVKKIIDINNESPLEIYLGQSISKGEKMDITIQKSVELGVTSIFPLFTRYCNVKLDKDRLIKKNFHWQKIAISAAEQSQRNYVPKIFQAVNIIDWYSITKNIDIRLIFTPYHSSIKKNIKIRDLQNNVKNVAILVGSEGGFSQEEIQLSEKNGFIPISLGPRILRTETAALSIISILQAKWGDL